MKENTKGTSIIAKVFCGIGTILVSIGGYFLWVNSRSFEGSFFGMTFQMPLERTEHYCRRKSNGIFTIDTNAYQSCILENSSKSDRHKRLVNYMLETFTDDKTHKATITNSEAECMAKKIESQLTDSQIDDFINGKAIGDQLGTSAGVKAMNNILQCMQ